MLAYIISAYKDPEHLSLLVDTLDDGNSDFFIHIDLNVDIRPFERLLKQRVVFVPRHRITWGGWQQVEYQRELLRAALATGKPYSHIVCLTGQDHPVWDNRRIHDFFESRPSQQFISAVNITRIGDRGQLSKVRNYHFFRDTNIPAWLRNKLIVASRNALKFIHVTRPATAPLSGSRVDVFMGSDYWALTPSCARHVLHVLDTQPAYVRYFRHTFAPSEMCIHTIVCNSQFAADAMAFRGKAYPGLAALTPLHFIDYRGSVRTLTIDYLPQLRASDKPFCRKVVTNVSDSLIAALPIP